MLKQVSLKSYKNAVGIFKEDIHNKILKKKMEDQLYTQYVMSAIKEAEKNIKNGGKTYTLEEYRERMRKLYGAEV